ncbi:ferritin-2, chloroplastic-like [Wolffia australiana]
MADIIRHITHYGDDTMTDHITVTKFLARDADGDGDRVPRTGDVIFSPWKAKNGRLTTAVASFESGSRATTGVIFEPFEEMKNDVFFIPSAPNESLVCHKYSEACEVAINEQIKEYSVAYTCHALFAYFDMDNIALQGFAK